MLSLLRCNPLSRVLLTCLFLCCRVLALGQSDRPAPLRRAIAASRPLHQAPRTQRFNLSIGLPLRNQDELDALLPQLSDPASGQFHQYLTPEQFAARFAPSEEDYQALIQFARQNGLTVTHTHSNRGVLSVSGASADVEKAFQVKLMTYSHPTRGEFYAPDREPTLPAGTRALDVMGLDNFAPPQPMGVARAALAATNPLVSGSGPNGYLIGKDFRAAYAPGVTLTGSGQTVGLLEFDGFFAGDVTRNFAAAGLPPVPVQTVLIDGVSGAAGGENIEVILDIMMASYMAPGLTKVMVYEGATPNDILNRMATDNLAQQLSSSWGFGGVNATTEQIFKQYIAQGQSFMQASGDSGAYSNGVMTPSDDPNVTVVGGTSLATSGAAGPWLSESTWSGSGGGVSTTYAIPSYQAGVAMASKGGSTKMRNIPDVALTAAIEMYLICDNGAAYSVGGTSAAAPLWAGFLALANQQAAANSRPRVGFLNPLIYGIGSSGNYASDFHDITTGSNGFNAVGGFDLATGWGSPAGQHLINDLMGSSAAPNFTLTLPVAALAIRQPVAGATTSGASSLSIAPVSGFTGTVALAVTGLPAGVTTAFSPASSVLSSTAAGSSSLTVTVGTSAAAGVYPLTITGLSGKVSGTATLTLSILAPSFTLTPASAAVTVVRPGSSTTAIAIGAVNGFAGSVALTTSTLPAGLTAAFSASTATTGSVPSFTAGSATVSGVYSVTVNGVSGSLKASTTVAVTVVTPSFTLTPSTATVTISRPGAATATIAVGAVNGFTGSVQFSIGTLPAGVTATWGTGSGNLLTLAAAGTAAAGTSAVTVTGVSGTLKVTTTVSVTVVAPSFTLAFLPASLAVPRGGSSAGTLTIGAVNGFSSAVTLTATGLPTGVTALFGTAAKGTAIVNFLAPPATIAGSYAVTITGVSGAMTATAHLTLVVVAPATASNFVNLAPNYNVLALATDSVAFAGSGIDGAANGLSEAYSANLTGVQQTVAGTAFYFGPAGVLDAVSGQTVALPAGQFASLKLLATGVNGAQASQTFRVTYTDGTSTSVVQSLSDWFSPAGFTGETRALTMAHRNTGTGLLDNRTFYLYEYSIALNPARTVASVTFPNNSNVVVLAASLTGASASTAK